MDLRGDLGVPPLFLLSVVDDDLYLCLTNRHPHSRSDNNLLVSQVASVDHGRVVASDKVGSINHKKQLVVVYLSVVLSRYFPWDLSHGFTTTWVRVVIFYISQILPCSAIWTACL